MNQLVYRNIIHRAKCDGDENVWRRVLPPVGERIYVGEAISLMADSIQAKRTIPDVANAVRAFGEAISGPNDAFSKPDGSLRSRDIFTYALAICEHPNQKNLDRLEILFERAEAMQDGNGHFWWKWGDGKVKDLNAVEFCMPGAGLVWLYHEKKVPPEAQEILQRLLKNGANACMSHRVPEKYTNIALMNAANLILLGKALNRIEVAEEGYRRLDQFCIYTYEWGIHEYCSPTYTGVSLCCLGLIERVCGEIPTPPKLTAPEDVRAKAQASALLELFWTDVVLNRLSSSALLGGAYSRKRGGYLKSEDGIKPYLDLDDVMWVNRWLDQKVEHLHAIYPALTLLKSWPDKFKRRSDNFSRLVRQSWGAGKNESRTHYLRDGITLSSSSAGCGKQDLPLTVDFRTSESEPESLRCCFVPDVENDPYGRKGDHHFPLLWAAAQHKTDALGLALYRPQSKDPHYHRRLKSYFVMPGDVDGIWIGGRRVVYDMESLLFRASDFKNIASLAVKLRDAPDALSQYLQGKFQPDMVEQRLKTYDGFNPPSAVLQMDLVDELNRLLQVDSFFDPHRFAHVVLTEKTRGLTGQKLQGEDTTYLNRLLLEEAYPDEIAKVYDMTARGEGFLSLKPDEALALRKDEAAVGVRVVWARTLKGGPAPVTLRYDRVRYNKFLYDDVFYNKEIIDAARLTVHHHVSRNSADRKEPWTNAGAALWVRIGSKLDTDTKFQDWCKKFAEAKVQEIQVEAEVRDRIKALKHLRIELQGEKGSLSVDTRSPRAGRFVAEIHPEPSQAVLECDREGGEVGRPILEGIEPIESLRGQPVAQGRKSYTDELDDALVHLGKIPGYWEAEDGRVWPPMEVADGVEASGGQYVWMPRKDRCRVKGSDVGSVTWRLDGFPAGTYYIWGRVLTLSRREDSFHVRVFQDMGNPICQAAWTMGVHRRWTWVPMDLRETGKSTRPTPLDLPPGEVKLQLFARKAGAKIDRLFITSDPKERPT